MIQQNYLLLCFLHLRVGCLSTQTKANDEHGIIAIVVVVAQCRWLLPRQPFEQNRPNRHAEDPPPIRPARPVVAANFRLMNRASELLGRGDLSLFQRSMAYVPWMLLYGDREP